MSGEWSPIFFPSWALWHRLCCKVEGWGLGVGLSYRDDSSLGSLMENRKALDSACERTAGCDQQTAPHTLAPQLVYSQSSQDITSVTVRQFHPSCAAVGVHVCLINQRSDQLSLKSRQKITSLQKVGGPPCARFGYQRKLQTDKPLKSNTMKPPPAARPQRSAMWWSLAC